MADLFGGTDLLLAAPAILCAVLGLVLLIGAVLHLRRGRVIRAGMGSLIATVFLGGGVILLLLGSNLYTYHRLTYEQAIARIHFWQSGPQQFLAEVDEVGEPGSDGRSYLLTGDEWQVDARILKWESLANLAGLNARYRLERISGRYSDIQQEREDARTVFRLSKDPGLDVWKWIVKLNARTDWIDTVYGNSAYMPMADEAEYEVVLTQSGILARPLNEQAQLAVSQWR